MGNSSQDFSVAAKLRDISRKNLAIPMEFIGFLPHDPAVSRSIFTRVPYILDKPNSPFAKGMRLLTQKLTAGTFPSTPQLFEDDEDIQELQQELQQDL
ncbi:MAG: hypothetical protein U5P10_07800 [Spirochaetia bacterium]|nr:hypothetical protein [Spirochaetia bacterium]